jgi:hypothetical protein
MCQSPPEAVFSTVAMVWTWFLTKLAALKAFLAPFLPVLETPTPGCLCTCQAYLSSAILTIMGANVVKPTLDELHVTANRPNSQEEAT